MSSSPNYSIFFYKNILKCIKLKTNKYNFSQIYFFNIYYHKKPSVNKIIIETNIFKFPLSNIFLKMFKKKISKSTLGSTLFRESSPDPDTFNSSLPRKKFFKGLQYSQTTLNQPPSKPTLPQNKDSPFLEKEWAKQSLNVGRNDKVLDKFMEERLKEFHAKINKIEKNESDEIEPPPVVVAKPEEGMEMEKLKEV